MYQEQFGLKRRPFRATATGADVFVGPQTAKTMAGLKKALTAKHGAFTPNNKQENEQDGIIRQSVSYHVEPVRGLLLLLGLTEVKDTRRKKHSVRFSLLYRNQNIIPK